MAGGAGRRRYAVFISYSHQDEKLADWLHKALEAYRTPGALVGKPGEHGPVLKRLGRCFRDRAELAASDDLGREIREALDQSDALIVLCSPKSAGSKYVEDEIRYFKSLGRGKRILAAIAGGEPHAAGKIVDGRTLTQADEAFPRALLHAVDANGQLTEAPETHEFIAADFRKGKDEREAGKLKLLAGLLGVRLDDLVQRERAAARRRTRLFAYATLAFAGLAVAATVFGFEAERQRGIAQRALDTAEERLKIAQARRIAGEAQLSLARAFDLDRLARAAPGEEAYGTDAESMAYQADRAVQRATLLSLESLNTAETLEGAIALRRALTMLWPAEVRRALRDDYLVGWSGENALAFYGEGEPHPVLNLTDASVTASSAAPTGADWGQNVSGEDTLTSPDGRYVLSESVDDMQGLMLRDTQGGDPILLPHEWMNPRALFSPDSRYVATLTGQVSMDAADEGAEALPGSAIRVFETATGRLLFHVTLAQDGGIDSAALSPDGKALATHVGSVFGRNGTLIWTLWPEDARAQACARLTQNMSRSEWAAFVPERDYASTCPGLPEPEY